MKHYLTAIALSLLATTAAAHGDEHKPKPAAAAVKKKVVGMPAAQKVR